MSIINISNLSFAYDGSYDSVFENVTFQIDTRWHLGFTSRNGRGKTTFLKLLMGEYEYSGVITSSVNFQYFPIEVNDKSELTCNIIADICPCHEQWEILREFNLLDLADNVLYRPFESLSGGEQSKVLLAALFLNDNSFLLIDEPTNHLDANARKIVSNYLKSKSGFILVSHDRDFLDNCIDHILSINKTNIEIQRGNFSSFFTNKTNQDSFEISENDKLKKDIDRLTAAARATAGWSDKIEKTKLGSKNSGLRPDKGFIGHKSAKMMKRSKSIEGRKKNEIEIKSTLLKNIEKKEELKLSPLTYRRKILVEINDLSIKYADKRVFSNLSFTIEQGDRVALMGKNGSGKSSILKLIYGESIEYSGSVSIGSQLKMSYVSQDTSFLNGSLSDFAKSSKIDESLFKTILRKLDFSRTLFDKMMENYSGGQKKKVLLAKSLCESANLYLWDEPLNFIDIYSRMQVEELILEYKPTIIFVEHDIVFCESVATKQIII